MSLAAGSCGGYNSSSAIEEMSSKSVKDVGAIFKFLSENPKIVFKSQQIDEPDLNVEDKIKIAAELFAEDCNKFLFRFGNFLENPQLQFLKDNFKTDENLVYNLNLLMKQSAKRAKTVRNRRFAALQKMSVEEDEYFGEIEMMKREPNLYEQMIGQYLTNTEKQIRDGFGTKEMPFSEILLQTMDSEETENLRKAQKQMEGPDLEDDEEVGEDDQIEDEELYPKIPNSFRKQWGNFEDDLADSTPNAMDKKQKKTKYITAEERCLLRDEFIGIMYSNFLEGHDHEHFNYSAVDDSTEFDDLEQIGQDEEDKYFESDDETEISKKIVEQMDDSSEDDLDILIRQMNEEAAGKCSNSNEIYNPKEIDKTEKIDIDI